MSIEFTKVKSTTLDLDSKIPIGKLTGCRVCDCIEDNSEYLLWASKAGYLSFTQAVKELLQQRANEIQQARHYSEEIQPWEDDDIPF